MKKRRIKHRSAFQRWLYRIRIRTLKIDILTLFASLTILTVTLIMCYSYFKNYHAILKYSKGMMERNSTAIIQRITSLQKNTELIIETSSALALGGKLFSANNQQLENYMLRIIQIDPEADSFFIGFKNGDRFLVKRIFTEKHFANDPNKPLPTGATYIIKITDQTHTPIEEWRYTDKNFTTLGTEHFDKPSIISQTRPWYIGALKNSGVFWTDIYTFLNSNDQGVTASKAIYDANHRLVGVVGMDISFNGLSNFFDQLTIGKYGRAFITDINGNILVPQGDFLKQSLIPSGVIKAAINNYRKNNQQNFSFEYKDKRYLSYIGNYQKIFNNPWIIVTIVPFSDFFSDLIQTQLEIILITLIILGLSLSVIHYFSKRISKPIVSLSKEVDKVTNLDLSSHKRIPSYIVEIRIMDASIAAMRAALRSFSRYVPKEIVRQLLAQGNEIELHVDKKKLTIFFSDIKDFTTIAETNPLSTLMPLLNEYFDGISKIILHNQGTIDKYIGDSVMAIWGAPLANPQHAIFACTAALKCQIFVNRFNKKCRELGNPEFITRFGISSGTVFVGNIGTLERMNYTVIGDAVNTAARLQVTDKIYHVNIIISEEVYVQTDDFFLVRPLDMVEVKGKKTKIKIYELVAMNNEDPEISATALEKELCDKFTAAYEEYVAEHYPKAEQLFKEIHQRFPEDYPTEFYLERLKKLQNGQSIS
ncbi:MAG: hypothetical protein JSR33_04600 [Proteobacteria bacterium]|nr:hypothetical protein [Pseudomonadota bacterium]